MIASIRKMKMHIKKSIKTLFKYFGYELKKNPEGHVFHLNAYADQKALLSQLEVKVVFDVGANVGQTVGQYQKLFNGASIYCFEPFDDVFSALSETYRKSDFIKLYKIAVTSTTGKQRFFLNEANSTNSLLTISVDSHKYVDSSLTKNLGYLDVETTTLDDFCCRESIDKIQILKMDIQGGELMALQGAANLLNRQAIDLVYTEVLFVELYEKQASFHDICKFLETYGYVLYGMYDLNYSKNGILAWGDAIFISPSFEEALNINQ